MATKKTFSPATEAFTKDLQEQADEILDGIEKILEKAPVAEKPKVEVKLTFEDEYALFRAQANHFYQVILAERTKNNSQQTELNYAFSIIQELYTRLRAVDGAIKTYSESHYKPVPINPNAL